MSTEADPPPETITRAAGRTGGRDDERAAGGPGSRASASPRDDDRVKRPYMAAADRRRHLLDAAARLMAREGVNGFTMVALAKEADVSRPLVYRHFPDLETFFVEFFSDQGRRYMDRVDAAHETTPGLPAMSTAFHYMVEMNAGDFRAMSALVHDQLDEHLAPTRAWFRDRIVERWRPIVRDMDVDDDLMAAALWTIVSSAVSIAAMVRLGEISLEQGESLLYSLATGTMMSLASAG